MPFDDLQLSLRAQECPYPTDLVGRIPGIPVGTTVVSQVLRSRRTWYYFDFLQFASRNNAAEAGVHRSQMGGIHGYGQFVIWYCSPLAYNQPILTHRRASKGAFAICQSAGYANEDEGEKLLYRGQGGRNLEGNKRTTVEQTKNQDMKLGNAALAKSMELNTPVRVMRGAKVQLYPVGFVDRSGFVLSLLFSWNHHSPSSPLSFQSVSKPPTVTTGCTR